MVRKTVTTVEDDDADPKKDGELVEDEETIRALTEIEGADDVRWQIFRVSGPDKGYLTEISTGELTLHRIAEFGAGIYRVRGIKEDGKYFKSRQIRISKPPDPNPTRLMNEALEKAKSGDMTMMQFMTMLMNQQQESSRTLTQVMIAAMQRPEQRSIPWEAVITALPPSLLALKEFFANKADPMKQMMDAITVTEKLRGDGDKGGTSWPDLVKEGLSNLPAALQSLRPSAPTPAPGPTATPIPPPNAPALPIRTPEAVPPPDPTMQLNLLPWLRELLAKLLSAAQRNGNTALYAELLLEELPDAITDEQLLQLLGVDDWWAKLTLFDARLRPYQGWFAQLRDNVLTLLEPDEEPHDDSAPESRRRAATDPDPLPPTADGADADAG